MRSQYQLLIKAEGTRDPTRRESYDGDERLDVRDLCFQTTTQVRAQEISCFRHTLILDGKAYKILDVVRKEITRNR
jgi:hypothetical protein